VLPGSIRAAAEVDVTELPGETRSRREEGPESAGGLEKLALDDPTVRGVDYLPRSGAEVSEAYAAAMREANRHLGTVAVSLDSRRGQSGKHFQLSEALIPVERPPQDFAFPTKLNGVLPPEMSAGAAFRALRAVDFHQPARAADFRRMP
jgi:hypothetical protein